MKLSRIHRKNFIIGFLFALPGIIYLLGLVLLPILQSIYYSLCDYSILSPPKFIGLANYKELFSDSRVWKSITNTLFMVITTPIPLAMALFLASLLNRKVRAMPVYRTIYYIPSLVPAVAVSILWRWIYNGKYGILNKILALIGINGPMWLMDPNWTKPALVIMGLWGVGSNMIIYLAALQGVPENLYEAADLDGAGRFRKFWNITIPSIAPITLFLLITGIIYSFQYFTQAYIFTLSGDQLGSYGPGDSLIFLNYYIYDSAFRNLRMGYAAALSWVLFVLCGIFTVSIFRANKNSYQGEG